jgi:hypothetical protein
LPLLLPNLDDLRWKDLVAEGKSLIPSYAEKWTNHNAADPGITLIELFAYISGTLMYQVNRITEADIAQFLSLMSGGDWKRDKGLASDAPLNSMQMRQAVRTATTTEEKRAAFSKLWSPARAVTAQDFESLVCAIKGVRRAKCLPVRNLENEDPWSRWRDEAGHVSVVILTSSGAYPSAELLAHARQALEPARLLTTRVHVVAPRYVKVGVQLRIVAKRNTRGGDRLQDTVAEKLRLFLDPHLGWFDGKGWPLGRDLHLSELYQLVAGMDAVDSVSASRDGQGVVQDEITVEIPYQERIVRDQGGRFQAVTLRPDELFESHIEASSMQITKQR